VAKQFISTLLSIINKVIREKIDHKNDLEHKSRENYFAKCDINFDI